MSGGIVLLGINNAGAGFVYILAFFAFCFIAVPVGIIILACCHVVKEIRRDFKRPKDPTPLN